MRIARALAFLSFAAAAAYGPLSPAHAGTLADARESLRTVADTAQAVCDTVANVARTVEGAIGPVTGPAGPGGDVLPAVRCPQQALDLARTIDGVLPPPAVSYPEYIVVLRNPDPPAIDGNAVSYALNSVTATPDGAAFYAWQHGATVRYVYRTALRGYAAEMSPATLDAVRADSNVDHISADQTFTTYDDVRQPNPPWGLDRIDQRSLPLDNNYYYSQTAAPVRAYVIDSGINYSHVDFGGRAVLGEDEITPGGNGADCLGHGTHVAGTIGGATSGVAKAVTLVSVRVFACMGTTTGAAIIAGIDWVTSDHQARGGPAVANMSLGGSAFTDIDTAVQNSIASGVSYSVAAGNGDSNHVPQDACNYSPARVPEAMTIASVDSSDTVASDSNYGSCVDWFAPGVGITSADYSSNTGFVTKSGTSMATPHNAGVAALYLEANPTATPAQVAAAIGAKTT